MADSPASGVQLAQQKPHGSRDRARADRSRRLRRPHAQGAGQPGHWPSSSFVEFQQHFGGLWQPVDPLLRGRAVLRERRPRGAHRARGQRRAPADDHPARSRRRAASRGTQSRLARVPARLGRLRRPERHRARALQPRGAARAHRRLRAGRGPGDLPTRLDRAGRGALRAPTCCSSRAWCAWPAACRRSVPDRSAGGPGGVAVGYTLSNPDGDDGAPLTDYDIIGAAASRQRTVRAPGRSRASTCCASRRWRASATWDCRRCSWRRACAGSGRRCCMVDPPASWSTRARGAGCAAAVAVPQRQRGHVLPARAGLRPPARPRRGIRLLRGGGRHDRALGRDLAGVGAAESEEAMLRPGLRPAVPVNEAERVRLSQAGINTLVSVRSGGAHRREPAHARRQRRPRTGVTSRRAAWRCSSRRASSRAPAGCCSSTTVRRSGSARRRRSRRFSMSSPRREPSRGRRPMRVTS